LIKHNTPSRKQPGRAEEAKRAAAQARASAPHARQDRGQLQPLAGSALDERIATSLP
jgi:hypothetical protein